MLQAVLLGISITKCEELLGPIVSTSSIAEGRFKTFRFGVQDDDYILASVHDGVVIHVMIYNKHLSNGILALLTTYSGSPDWSEDKERKMAVTKHFRGLDPKFKGFTYYYSPGFCALHNKLKVGDQIEIVPNDFIDRLEAIPSKVKTPVLPPEETSFYYRDYCFKTRIGETKGFSHAFGHCKELSVLNNPEGFLIHQLISLDLSDPALPLPFTCLTSLPLVFCFSFEICTIEYDILADDEISLTKVDGFDFQADRPYPGFPSRFPPLAFSISPSTPCTLIDFDCDTFLMLGGGSTDDFICIVPPSPIYKVKFWRDDLHFHQRHIKVFIDLDSRHVTAFNDDHIP